MDLSTVFAKLRAHRYPQVRDLLADVLLALDNAKHFNPPRHPVHVAAGTLKVKAPSPLHVYLQSTRSTLAVMSFFF